MAMATIRQVQSDSDFGTEMTNAGSRLVVVDYFATWCGPCRTIAPAFADMSTRYPKAVFLKVDVDQCQETAQGQGVSAMPTFMFYRNGEKIDSLRGADATLLEEKIKKWYSAGEGDDMDSPVKGHMDLLHMVNKSTSECLNESDEHTLSHLLESGSDEGSYLESDCDEQLILQLGFTQTVKLHSLMLHCYKAPNGPKTVKIFINQPHTLDFDSATGMEPVQTLVLTAEDLAQGGICQLKFVKYQNVSSLSLFVMDNQDGSDVTRIDRLAIIGSPTSTTNMAEFKRVAGKKGESH